MWAGIFQTYGFILQLKDSETGTKERFDASLVNFNQELKNLNVESLRPPWAVKG
jgi:hypothetical protein